MRYQFASLAVVATVSLVAPVAVHAEDAAAYVTSAKAHLEKHEYDKAIADCNKALEFDFESAAAYNVRARAWNAKAAREEASGAYQAWLSYRAKGLDDCDEALALDPAFADAYVTRGDAWTSENRFDKAAADFKRALALDTNSARAYCVRAHLEFKLRDYDTVIANCGKAVSLDPKLAEAYMRRGCAWAEKREYEKALTDNEKALSLDPELWEAHIERGNALSARGRQEDAITEYNRALQIVPQDWRALNDLGVVHWRLAQEQDRRAAAAAAAGDGKTASMCRQRCADLKDQARAYWRRVIALRPNACDILSNLGYAFTDANNLEQAEFYLRRAVEVNMGNGRPHNNLGRVLLRRSQKYDVDATAAEADGKTNQADAERADELRKAAKEKRDAAIEQFEKAVELDPSLLEARLNLGEVFTQMKDYNKAGNQYRAIRKYEDELKDKTNDPDDFANFSQGRFGLARVAVARGQVDDAIQGLKAAVHLNPNNLAAWDMLATQFYMRGSDREGGEAVRSYLAKMPPAARQQAAKHLAKQLDDAGKHDAAEKARKAANPSQ
jgi:tetratricopeptide (TPR) repeat protein